jgi:hypothetical protein
MDLINARQMEHIQTGTAVCLCEQAGQALLKSDNFSLDVILPNFLKVEAYDHILNIFEPVFSSRLSLYVVVKHRIPLPESLCQLHSTSR